jgi:hypothetical protein
MNLLSFHYLKIKVGKQVSIVYQNTLIKNNKALIKKRKILQFLINKQKIKQQLIFKKCGEDIGRGRI